MGIVFVVVVVVDGDGAVDCAVDGGGATSVVTISVVDGGGTFSVVDGGGTFSVVDGGALDVAIVLACGKQNILP